LGQALHLFVERGLPLIRSDSRSIGAQLAPGRGYRVEKTAPMCWHVAVEVLAHPASKGGTASTGRDGEGQVAAFHEGRGNQVTVWDVVDGQHQYATAAGLGGHRRIQSAIVGGRESVVCSGQVAIGVGPG
jgi:hypothetical protein